MAACRLITTYKAYNNPSLSLSLFLFLPSLCTYIITFSSKKQTQNNNYTHRFYINPILLASFLFKFPHLGEISSSHSLFSIISFYGQILRCHENKTTTKKKFLALYANKRMDELPGSFGTSASLALRLGQTIFSFASLLFMCFDVQFYSYTAFCYLVTVMGLVVPWSLTLVVVDAYSVFVKFLPQQPRTILIIVLGDWALSYLLLSAACSTASITDLLFDGSYCPAKLCSRYQLSAAMAFLTWFLCQGSFLFNLWLLPSLFQSAALRL